MRNPFEYGGVVSGDAFCNRQQETGDLVRAMENGEKLFVFSERRYGKTSLVRAALGQLPRQGYVSAFRWGRSPRNTGSPLSGSALRTRTRALIRNTSTRFAHCRRGIRFTPSMFVTCCGSCASRRRR